MSQSVNATHANSGRLDSLEPTVSSSVSTCNTQEPIILTIEQAEADLSKEISSSVLQQSPNFVTVSGNSNCPQTPSTPGSTSEVSPAKSEDCDGSGFDKRKSKKRVHFKSPSPESDGKTLPSTRAKKSKVSWSSVFFFFFFFKKEKVSCLHFPGNDAKMVGQFNFLKLIT